MRKPKQKNYAYDARIALWLSRDPMGEPGGANLFEMIGNDPVNRTDFLGLVESSAASQGAMILLASTLQASCYGTSEIVIALTRLISSRMDWAVEEILRHLINGGGSHYNQFDDPSWSSYMMASEALKNRMRAFWLGKFAEIKRGPNATTFQTIDINETTSAALGRENWRDFTGYGLINGANPGVEIRGKLTSDCGNKFSGTFRYTFRDRLDANWGVDGDMVFYALAKAGSLGNAQPLEASFLWERSFEFSFIPSSNSGWPY